VVALALAGAGMAAKPGLRDPRVRMAAAIGAAGLALSFGPALPGYATLYQWFPLLQGVRGPRGSGPLPWWPLRCWRASARLPCARGAERAAGGRCSSPPSSRP